MSLQLSRLEQSIGVTISLIGILICWVYLSIVHLLLEGYMMASLITMGVGTLLSWAYLISLLRTFRRAGDADGVDYLNLAVIKYVLAFFMVFYGLPKVGGHFFAYSLFTLDQRMGVVDEMPLVFYMFGKNPWHELLAGGMELVPGLLLLHRRTTYLAALLLLPVTGQVFILNLFFSISGGLTFLFSIILLAGNLYLVYSQKRGIIIFLKSLIEVPTPAMSPRSAMTARVIQWLVYGLIALICARFMYHEVSSALAPPSDYRRLIGAYSLESVTKGGAPVEVAQERRYYQDLYIDHQPRWNRLVRADQTNASFKLSLKEDKGFSLIVNEAEGFGDETQLAPKYDLKSELKGSYSITDEGFILKGEQLGDQLVLRYKRRAPYPRSWFW